MLLLYQDSKGFSSVHQACVNNHADVLAYVVSRGAKIDAAAVDPNLKLATTPLIMSATRGYLQCMRVLVMAGADVNEKDKEVSNHRDRST